MTVVEARHWNTLLMIDAYLVERMGKRKEVGRGGKRCEEEVGRGGKMGKRWKDDFIG